MKNQDRNRRAIPSTARPPQWLYDLADVHQRLRFVMADPDLAFDDGLRSAADRIALAISAAVKNAVDK
jgi:hypothetical protein